MGGGSHDCCAHGCCRQSPSVRPKISKAKRLQTTGTACPYKPNGHGSLLASEDSLLCLGPLAQRLKPLTRLSALTLPQMSRRPGSTVPRAPMLQAAAQAEPKKNRMLHTLPAKPSLEIQSLRSPVNGSKKPSSGSASRAFAQGISEVIRMSNVLASAHGSLKMTLCYMCCDTAAFRCFQNKTTNPTIRIKKLKSRPRPRQ